MAEKNNGDWRLKAYDRYLDGSVFSLERFHSDATNDHEHCVFCWQKITDLDLPNCDKDGYCTTYEKTGQTHWVCKECFADFKEQFHFKEKKN